MNYSMLYNPVVTPATIVLVVTIVCPVTATRQRRIIATKIMLAGQHLFSRSGFFWLVNLVFMAVSVLHAGVFFGITENGHGVPGAAAYLGFAVSFFLDLVTVILMQAMLESRYRGEDGRARQFLFFITVTSATSTFANLAISLNDFNAAKMLPHAPTWVQIAAPYVLSSFPLFVIMMSIAAEMIVNLRPLDKLDEQEYEADEAKRVALLRIRNDYLERQSTEELRTLEIRAAMRSNKATHKPVFSWPFMKAKIVDAEVLTAQITEQLQEHYNEQIGALNEQITALKNAHYILDEQATEAILASPIYEIKEESNEHNNAPIDLTSRRNNAHLDEQKDTELPAHRGTPKRAASSESDVVKKVRRIVSQNRDITALALAQKIGKSRAQAGRLKRQIIDELDSKTPA